MSILQIHDLSYHWDYGDRPVFSDVSFTIENGDRAGLIGPNGCGKSTLARIIAGELEASRGIVSWPRPKPETGYLSQQVILGTHLTLRQFLFGARPELAEAQQIVNDAVDPKRNALLQTEFLRIDGHRFQARVERALGAFGFGESDVDLLLHQLSSGQRTRAMLARVLLSDPSFLILDEPTNHLDIPGREFLEQFLRDFSGTVLVISHDRFFLDRTVTRILDLRRGSLRDYPGNYSDYARIRDENEQRVLEEHFRQQQSVRKLERQLRQRLAWSQRKEKERIGAGGAKGHITRIAAKMAKRAKAVQTRIEHKLERERADKPYIEKRVSMKFPGQDPQAGYALTVDGLHKRFDGTTVLVDAGFSLMAGERLAVAGPNGCGKSTLLKILAGVLNRDAGTVRWAKRSKIGYYPQEQQELDPCATALEEVMRCGCDAQQARTFLGALLLREDYVLRPTAEFSSGERAKIIMARLLLSGSNVLLLDEPTNHLDIDAREALEQALREYAGTIILASHDRRLLSTLATAILAFENSAIRFHPKPYSHYMQDRQDLVHQGGAGKAQALTRPIAYPPVTGI